MPLAYLDPKYSFSPALLNTEERQIQYYCSHTCLKCFAGILGGVGIIPGSSPTYCSSGRYRYFSVLPYSSLSSFLPSTHPSSFIITPYILYCLCFFSVYSNCRSLCATMYRYIPPTATKIFSKTCYGEKKLQPTNLHI